MARTTKKRRQQLKHDRFRDTTLGYYDRLSHRVEGRRRTILYAVGGAAALVVLLLVFNWWRESRADAARLALGKAIEIAEAPVTTGTPLPNQTGPSFPNEQERAQKAVEEFQKVQREHGSPYSDLARYFAAVNLVTVERERGIKELEDLTRGGNDEVASRARFALAQAREAEALLTARRAEEELRAAGGKAVERALTGAESLTPSELRVATLAAQGLTNREIAQRLFLTMKTVEMHLGSTYRKLDIGSRRDLPTALAD